MIRALDVLCRPFLGISRLPKVTRHHPVPIPPVVISRTFSSSRPSRAGYSVRSDSKPKALQTRLVGQLEQVPETGRWRFMVISPNFEDKIGKLAYQEILQDNANQILPPNHIIARNIRRIVSRILYASNLGEIRGYSTPLGGPGRPWGDAEGSWDPDSQRQNAYQSATPRQWEVVVVGNPKIVNAMAVPGTRAKQRFKKMSMVCA
ncbi:hypothetical protein C0992_011787 [Termitomyces sp. T32_za158]|nr:hypothetical protein C0992_011787 [Termitomyces sp. T32_za158]